MRKSILAACALGMLLAGQGVAEDWRLELLKQEGIGVTPEELRQAAAGFSTKDVDFGQTYEQLGAEEFRVRENAERALVSSGIKALQWLKRQPVSPDPEIRSRVEAILGALENPGMNARETALRHAVESLLAETGKKTDPTTGGMFYEGFGGTLTAPEKTYRSFQVEAPGGMSVAVDKGRLVMAGRRAGDGDQRLVLRAKDWPGADTFPDRFRVSAKLGGTAGGAGAWHMGITVGKVRALFHPGMEGGSFRFEQVETQVGIVTNEGMGFTPASNRLQRMSVDVRVMADGGVKLVARVTANDGKIFKRSCEITTDVIGPLDRVSLDRSGRSGGDALFDDFMIELK